MLRLLGGALSEGGNIFAWAKQTFNLSQLDIEAELAAVSALGRSLYVLDEPEITALGIAQLLHCALKTDKITAATRNISHEILPDSNHFVIFEYEQERQIALYYKLDC